MDTGIVHIISTMINQMVHPQYEGTKHRTDFVKEYLQFLNYIEKSDIIKVNKKFDDKEITTIVIGVNEIDSSQRILR